jgi:hypothetical protein
VFQSALNALGRKRPQDFTSGNPSLDSLADAVSQYRPNKANKTEESPPFTDESDEFGGEDGEEAEEGGSVITDSRTAAVCPSFLPPSSFPSVFPTGFT